jgi:hypothetical protein
MLLSNHQIAAEHVDVCIGQLLVGQSKVCDRVGHRCSSWYGGGQFEMPVMPLPGLAPRTNSTTIMITASWSNMNSLIAPSGRSAAVGANTKNSTGPDGAADESEQGHHESGQTGPV